MSAGILNAVPRFAASTPIEQARAAGLSTRDLQDLTFESSVKLVIRRVRAILEQGDRLASTDSELMWKLSEADKDALRDLRRQLIERDLYEQLYGPLTFAVSVEGEVNPA